MRDPMPRSSIRDLIYPFPEPRAILTPLLSLSPSCSLLIGVLT